MAQNNKKKNSILEFYAGYSIATGEYSSTDIASEKSGYAGYGWLAQLTYDWMGSHDFGLAIQYTFQKNPFKEEAESVHPEGIHDSLYFLGPGSWNNNYLMIGPAYMKTFNKILVDVKILAGAVISSGRTFSTTNPSNHENSSNTATGFAFQLSAGVGYLLTGHLALKINFNYLAGWPSKKKQYDAQFIGYDSYKDPVSGHVILKPVYSAPAEYTINRIISTLNPGIGLVYKF